MCRFSSVDQLGLASTQFYEHVKKLRKVKQFENGIKSVIFIKNSILADFCQFYTSLK